MIDHTVVDKLREIGRQVKTLLPGVNGNVQINLSKDPKKEPKLNLNLADVTEAKK